MRRKEKPVGQAPSLNPPLLDGLRSLASRRRLSAGMFAFTERRVGGWVIAIAVANLYL